MGSSQVLEANSEEPIAGQKAETSDDNFVFDTTMLAIFHFFGERVGT